jgi:hypothetical protein
LCDRARAAAALRELRLVDARMSGANSARRRHDAEIVEQHDAGVLRPAPRNSRT